VPQSRYAKAALLAAASLGTVALSSAPRGRDLDTRVFRLLNRRRSSRADLLFGAVTELGSLYASLGAAGALSLAGRRREAARALAAAVAMWGIGQAAKRIVARPRPYEVVPPIEDFRLLIGRPAGASWPSSHPAVLLAFSATAERELGLGPLARIVVQGLAGLVGASRVALGVHYPSDVVGGVLLGRAVAFVAGSNRKGAG
jgi:membrane-associated phospholipid phosphatase